MLNFISIKNQWLLLLIVMAGIIVYLYYRKKYYLDSEIDDSEGFTQTTPYVLKTDDLIYDNFYAGIYDTLYETDKRTNFEVQTIIEITQPSTHSSVMLDIGCGTGHLVNSLNKKGYKTFGIDKSHAMIQQAVVQFPDIADKFKIEDSTDAMLFDRDSFTHIICTHFTIYHFTDKMAFFRRAYFWLVQNGYLILHLVNRGKYNPVVPLGMSGIPTQLAENLTENPKEISKKRITDTEIEFPGFQYKNKCSFKNTESTNCVGVQETFTDKKTNNVRQNEYTMHMEDVDAIVHMAKTCKFIPISQIHMTGDKNQFIYIFEKMM